MADSAVWDHRSYMDHPSWSDGHSSEWDSHLHHDPPDAITTIKDRGNIGQQGLGSEVIQTTKRNVLTKLSTPGRLGVQTEQGSDGITSQITLVSTQNHTSTITVTNGTTTDAYSITQPYDMPNVGGARVPSPPQGYFAQHRVFLLSVVAAAVVILVIAILLIVIVLRRRSRKKNRELESAKSTEAPTNRGGRRLVKMESQEHTYEEVELNKGNDAPGEDDSLDSKPTTDPVEGGKTDVRDTSGDKIEKKPFYFELNESNGQSTTPVYSMPIVKRKDETGFPAKTEKPTKNIVHRLYSEPCHFTKKEEQGNKARENVRYSTPAPTYFILDHSQDPHEKRGPATLPRGKLVRQSDVTIEKYDTLDRSLIVTSSSPTSSNGDSARNESLLRDTRMAKTKGAQIIVDSSAGDRVYNQLNLDQVNSSSAATSTDNESPNEKTASNLFEEKGYNVLAF